MKQTDTSAHKAAREDKLTRHEKGMGPEQGPQSATEEANANNARHSRQEAKGQKATQFDGNPNPEGASSSTFKPADDTPLRLHKEKMTRGKA